MKLPHLEFPSVSSGIARPSWVQERSLFCYSFAMPESTKAEPLGTSWGGSQEDDSQPCSAHWSASSVPQTLLRLRYPRRGPAQHRPCHLSTKAALSGTAWLTQCSYQVRPSPTWRAQVRGWEDRGCSFQGRVPAHQRTTHCLSPAVSYLVLRLAETHRPVEASYLSSSVSQTGVQQ